jgi:hypothetical protein
MRCDANCAMIRAWGGFQEQLHGHNYRALVWLVAAVCNCVKEAVNDMCK